MKKHGTTIVLIIVFCIGLILILYPTLSDAWNVWHQSRTVMSYTGAVAEMDRESREQMWEDAILYNQKLAEAGTRWILSDEEKEEYENKLNVDGSGMMTYVEIPKIDCRLPVYHGTDEEVLKTAAGHLEGTSLPVGGDSTHCVISGHRGLPSARLFTDLDQLTEGDIFLIRTLDEVLTYEVDQIRIVRPDELDALQIETGKDYCTLVTCTPYGINTHRLLVRGHRIESKDSAGVRVAADALQVNPVVAAAILAAGITLILLSISVVKKKRL